MKTALILSLVTLACPILALQAFTASECNGPAQTVDIGNGCVGLPTSRSFQAQDNDGVQLFNGPNCQGSPQSVHPGQCVAGSFGSALKANGQQKRDSPHQPAPVPPKNGNTDAPGTPQDPAHARRGTRPPPPQQQPQPGQPKKDDDEKPAPPHRRDVGPPPKHDDDKSEPNPKQPPHHGRRGADKPKPKPQPESGHDKKVPPHH